MEAPDAMAPAERYNGDGDEAVKVREVLRRLQADGWRVARTRGSHRVLKHPTKVGIVVLPGNANDDVAPGTLRSVWQQAQLED